MSLTNDKVPECRCKTILAGSRHLSSIFSECRRDLRGRTPCVAALDKMVVSDRRQRRPVRAPCHDKRCDLPSTPIRHQSTFDRKSCSCSSRRRRRIWPPFLKSSRRTFRDHLLCVLPDLPSLLAAILSCKALHDVYSLRKKSIINDVTKNEAGPAMRYAVAVTRGMMHMADAKENGGWLWLWLGIEGNNNEGEYWNEEVRLEDVKGWKALNIVSAAEAIEKGV